MSKKICNDIGTDSGKCVLIATDCVNVNVLYIYSSTGPSSVSRAYLFSTRVRITSMSLREAQNVVSHVLADAHRNTDCVHS